MAKIEKRTDISKEPRIGDGHINKDGTNLKK